MYKNKIIALCLLASSMTALADSEVTKEVVKSFSVEAKSELRLENVNGDVDIKGWDKDEIKVSATISADDQKSLDRISVDMTQNSRGVNVETHYKKSSSWKRHNSGRVDYHIMVPNDARLSSIELVNGSLEIDGVKGEMKLELVNGSIVANGLTADSEISSVNGSIDVSYQSISDSLRDIEIDTVNGRIKLSLPEQISADVDIETMHGSIRNDFGLSQNKNMFSGRNLHGTIGSGDVKISIESVNGGVKLEKN